MFAVAERGVEQILHCESGEFVTENDEIHFSVGEQRYPVRAFNVLLEVGTGKLEAARSILLVDSDGQTFAIAVDEVVDSRDVVVKGLGHYIPKMPGIVGATILGDGSVTPMLDLPELARRPTGMSATANVPEAIEDLPELPSALVVDDSLSARRAIVQLMGDAGYKVLEARDGMEAASILETQVPNVILTDLEMPRMNGMELARHIRGRAELTHVPIIMVTSRTTAKHQNQAQTAGVDVYVTKPFSEDQLLDHVVACVETSERNAASMSASARRAVKH